MSQSEKEKKTMTLPVALDAARVIIDLPVAYGFLHPGAVPGKVMGACGTASSLLGIYALWK